MSEIGTAMLAMTVARRLCRKKKITSTTSTTASTSSICTWCTEARMPVVRSDRTCMRTAPGSEAVSSGNCFLMASTVAITLAPGWRCTFRMTAGRSVPSAFFTVSAFASASALSAAQAPSWLFSALSTTWATSRMRTGAPFFHATIRFW